MRACSLCGAKDRPQVLSDQCNKGCQGNHVDGCNAVQHFVARDIRHHEGPLTQVMKRKGWAELGIFQGKKAIQRFLCRNCIRQQDEVIEIEQYKLKVGKEAEQGSELNMYQILCN